MDCTPQLLHLIMIEKDPADVEQAVQQFKQQGFELKLFRVENEEAFYTALESEIDLILAEWYLPELPGLRALQILHEKMLDIPLIVFSDQISNGEVINAVRQGAYDCVPKSQAVKLGAMAQGALEFAHQRHERRKKEDVMRMAETELRALFDTLCDVVLVLDREGFYRKVAPTGHEFLIKPVEQLLGKNLKDIFPGEQGRIFIEVIQKVLDKHQIEHIEYEIPLHGRPTWFEASISPISEDLVIWVARDITERKRVDLALRRQSAALNVAANAMLITDRNGAVEWVNPAFSRLTGYSAAEALGKNPRDLVRSGQHDRKFFKQMWDTILSGAVWHGEVINRRKDGQLYVEEQTITPLLNSEGQVSQFIAVKQDISERKQTETALRESELRFRALFEQAGVGVAQADSQTGQFVRVNQKFCQILGYSLDEVLDTTFLNVTHPDDLKVDLYHMERLKAGEIREYSMEKRYYRKDNSLIWVTITVSPMWQPGEKPNYHIAVVQDISERKKAEEALKKTTEQLSLAIESSGMGIWDWIIETDENLINARWAEMLGYTEEELTPLTVDTWYSLVHPEDHKNTQIYFERHLSGETPYCEYETRVRHKDGHWVWVLVRCKVTQWGPHGEPVRVSGTHLDISDRVHAAEALKKSSQELMEAYDATLQGWSNALELRERETAGHSQRVVRLTLSLAQRLGCTAEALVHIQRGALLHDIGKMGIPDSILLKPGPLSPDEWVIMRQHPLYAYQLLSKIAYLLPAVDIPYCHHEKWDGTGYPRGLKGNDIPFAARVFSVVDVWDALSSDRPYRPAWTPSAVIAYLVEHSGAQFDPRVVEAFLAMIKNEPL
jgi:PAS domain S-box-containing protein